MEAYRYVRAAAASEKTDCLVAVGGGRVTDIAKLLSTGFPDAGTLTEQIETGAPIERRVPVVAVPTTAGSGSEATPFTVIYVNRNKKLVDHPSLRPDAAVMDPDLLQHLPPKVVASSGLDAVCQSIESLLSRMSTRASSTFATRRLEIAHRHLPAAFDGDRAALALLCEAAHLADWAIAITRTTALHALSYTLTERYGLAHGHAVALYMARYLAEFGRQRERNCLLSLWSAAYDNVLGVLGCAAPAEVSFRWASYLHRIGLPATLAECALQSEVRIAAAGNVDPARLSNAPFALDTDSLVHLIA